MIIDMDENIKIRQEYYFDLYNKFYQNYEYKNIRYIKFNKYDSE